MKISSNCALVGSTGFIGTTLKRQRSFTHYFQSQNSHLIQESSYSELVCAGAPAQKWLANESPTADFLNIERLWQSLKNVQADHFTLISTVDVFSSPVGVNELSEPSQSLGNAYGRNRFWLEERVKETFENHLIVRLPGLVGPGLKKNVIFDFQNQNNVDLIDSRSIFQFYPTRHLGDDISRARSESIKLIHLAAEPISVKQLALLGFGLRFENELNAIPAQYDLQTVHGGLWGRNSPHAYSVDSTMQAVFEYRRSSEGTIM